MTHECPGPNCSTDVPAAQLACAPHWYQVPKAIRTAVYRAWAGGRGTGTPEHRAAMLAAIAHMHEITPKRQR